MNTSVSGDQGIYGKVSRMLGWQAR